MEFDGGGQSFVHRFVLGGLIEKNIKDHGLGATCRQLFEELNMQRAIPSPFRRLFQLAARLFIHVNNDCFIRLNVGTDGEWKVVAQMNKAVTEGRQQQESAKKRSSKGSYRPEIPFLSESAFPVQGCSHFSVGHVIGEVAPRN